MYAVWLFRLLPAVVVAVAPAYAWAIPAQAALAGISFMLPVIPAIALLLVSIYLLLAGRLRLKGLLARAPGAFFLVVLTILVYGMFVRVSSAVDGIFDPVAQVKLVEFMTDNALQKREIAALDRVSRLPPGQPDAFRGTPLTVSPAQAVTELRAGRMTLVDVRPSGEFSAGRMEGAWRFPRGEIEKAVPEYFSQTASDLYLDSLARHAAADGRRLAFCCSFGVSLSYRTVTELRARGVPAVMVSGGCTTLRRHGGRFSDAPGVAPADAHVAPGLLADWVRAGRVKTVVAGESILSDLGNSLPAGPIVVVTEGWSPQENALRPIVGAIAQSRGIPVLGWSVTGKRTQDTGPAGALRRFGFAAEQEAGVLSLFLLFLAASAGIVACASLIAKSPRIIPLWGGFVLSAAGAWAVLHMFGGTIAAARIGQFFNSSSWAPLVLFLLTFVAVLARMVRRGGTLPSFELVPSAVDGDVGGEGRFTWPWILLSMLIAGFVASVPPPAAVATMLALTVLVTAVFLRDALLISGASVFGRYLRRTLAIIGDRHATSDIGAWPVHILSALACPAVLLRALRSGDAFEIVTRVPGRPGMISISTGSGHGVVVGIFSLSRPGGPNLRELDAARAGLAVAMAARLGVDLRFAWKKGARIPRVTVPSEFLRDSLKPRDAADVTDTVLHGQVLELARVSAGGITAGSGGDDAVATAERYVEQDPAPTPLTLSLLAARSARRGPAHMTGLLFGFSRHYSRTVRLGAGIYEVVRRPPRPAGVSRLRVAIARKYVRALDSVFSDFVLPDAMTVSEIIARRRGRVGPVMSAIRRLLGGLSILQEATAIAHAIILESCMRVSGGGAFDGLCGSRPVASGNSMSERGSWELMPRNGVDAAGLPFEVDVTRIFEPASGMSRGTVDRDIALWRRVEYYRGEFRRIIGWTCAVVGRDVASAGAASGLGDLVFFAGIRELRLCLGARGSSMADLLRSRRDCLESVRVVSLPAVVSVATIESIGPGGQRAMEMPSPDQGAILRGILVSGRLPAGGRVRIVRPGAVSGSFGPDEIPVIGVSDSRLLVNMLDCPAVVAESGGMLSHAAMLAREAGLTFVTGVGGAMARLADGDGIFIDTDGTIRVVASAGLEPCVGPAGGALVELAAAGPECGNKAASLAALISAGFRVPAGFVLTDTWLRNSGHRDGPLDPGVAAEIWGRIAPLDMGRGFIVRSSAGIEDGHLSSFAGVFTSVAGVNDAPGLARAVGQCLESRDSQAARALMRRLGIVGRGFSVIIQPVVPASHSGVVVSRLSSGGGAGRRGVFVEAQAGIGGVVDGAGTVAGFEVGRDDGTVTILNGTTMPDGLDVGKIRAVAECVVGAERLAGGPCDVEWCLFEDAVWIVQSRVIPGEAD